MKLKPKTEADEEAETLLAIRRSRISLLADHPFFGALAMKMPVKITKDLPIPTAATDGESLYYHPDFVKTLTPGELVFVTGHEILHAAYLHCQRRGNKDNRWLLATDIVVNQHLVNNKVGTMPKDLIYDPGLFNKGEGLVEKIYDLLKPDDSRKPMDDHLPMKGKPDPNAAAKMRAKLQGAMDVAKQCGNMPADIQAMLEQGGDAQVAWEDELFSEITADKGEDHTYAKRNRRYAALDVLLPGRYGEKMGDLVYAIDCSGSTSDDMVRRAGVEVKAAALSVKPEKVHIIYFDSDIKKHEEYNHDEDFEVHVHGRGGTAFSPIFRYIEEKGIDVAHCIVATDMDCDDFGPEPDYPVIWLAMDNHSDYAPWGKVIQT